MQRLDDSLRLSAHRVPDKVAVVSGERRITYRELAERVQRFAAGLRRRGIAPGDRVVISATNTIETVIAFWGTLEADAIAVPISPQTKRERHAWLIENCRAAAVMRDTSDIDELAAETPDGRSPSGGPDELATLIYTSGSTGRPKGVMLDHRNMTSAAASIAQYLQIAETDVIHGIMPLSFDYGLYQLILAVRQAATLVLAPPFTLPGQVLKQAAAERVTFFPGVPTVFAMLGQLPDSSRWDLSSVRSVTSTAATLTDANIDTIRRVFPRAQIFSMYGITECKRCTYLPPEDLDRKRGSVGIAIPNTELWLVDEHDRRVGPNQIGQLVIRGPHVMRGYWEAPEETARMLRPGPVAGERVLYTGDLCRLDEDGYLYFIGRMDDIIKSRGEKVPPKEVELVLAGVPGVVEAAVIGVPDEVQGHAVHAFVVVREPATVTTHELLSACRDKLEPHMVPRSIALVPSLPKNANGKIDKLALRESCAP